MFFTTIIFILTLLILILVHEAGHFLVAKKFKIKVLEFGFGFPPKAWGKKFGETILSINWLPLGGFVRLLGEDDTEEAALNNPRSFAKADVSKRIGVVIAGVAMNLVLAWILFYVVIIGQGFKIIYPAVESIVTIGSVEEGFPAKEAGIKSSDRILTIDGVKVTNIEDAVAAIKGKNGQSVSLMIGDLDGNPIREVSVTPKVTESGEKLIGVSFSPIGVKTYNTLVERVFSGITYSADVTKLTMVGFGTLINDLITGKFEKASSSVAGPVGLARVTNNILSIGPEALLLYLWFTGVISLTLAIMNVLPIPALDGGRLFFLLIEAITRKKIKAEVERIIHTVGFALLLILSFLIAFSDIRKLFS